MASIDWIKIKNEYISTNISQRKLAEKYNVSFSTLKDRANREKWAEEKKTTHNKITTKSQQKTVEIAVKKEVNRIENLLRLSDIAGEQIELALSQLSQDESVNVDNLKKLMSSLKDYKDIVREDKSTGNNGIWSEIVREYTKI